MVGPKKNSYKEFEDEKNSCGSKIPLPPKTFLMVRPLYDLYFRKGVLNTNEHGQCEGQKQH